LSGVDAEVLSRSIELPVDAVTTLLPVLPSGASTIDVKAILDEQDHYGEIIEEEEASVTQADALLLALRQSAWRSYEPQWLVPGANATEESENLPSLSEEGDIGELPPPVARRQSSSISLSNAISSLTASRSGIGRDSGDNIVRSLPDALRLILS